MSFVETLKKHGWFKPTLHCCMCSNGFEAYKIITSVRTKDEMKACQLTMTKVQQQQTKLKHFEFIGQIFIEIILLFTSLDLVMDLHHMLFQSGHTFIPFRTQLTIEGFQLIVDCIDMAI